MSEESARNSDSSPIAVLLFLVLLGVGVYKGWEGLENAGYVRQVATARVTAGPQWIQGETEECASQPVPSSMATPEHRYGDVFTEIDCEDGPSHTVKVEFYGRQLQPGINAAIWSCIRNNVSAFNDHAFTCKQTGTF